jgi:hypothetical protein
MKRECRSKKKGWKRRLEEFWAFLLFSSGKDSQGLASARLLRVAREKYGVNPTTIFLPFVSALSMQIFTGESLALKRRMIAIHVILD